MKSYSQEELDQIVSEISENILKEHVQDITDEITINIKGKSYNEAMVTTLAIICRAAQDNAKELIVETLDEILNG